MTEVDPGAQERHDFFFMPGVPDVTLGGLDLSRAMIRTVDADRDKAFDLRWAVGGIASPPDTVPSLLVVGDLQVRQDGFFVGCQVIAHLEFRNPDACPPAEDAEAIKALAAWSSSPMYDFAASHARSLIGSSVGCDIVVPTITPLADLDSMKIELGPPAQAAEEDPDRTDGAT